MSSRAISKLIEKYKINPIYIFLGRGEMYLIDESEFEKMSMRIKDLEDENVEKEETLREYRDEIRRIGRRNDDLIDITAAAIKYYKKDDDDAQDRGR